jgi:hypothetical protein
MIAAGAQRPGHAAGGVLAAGSGVLLDCDHQAPQRSIDGSERRADLGAVAGRCTHDDLVPQAADRTALLHQGTQHLDHVFGRAMLQVQYFHLAIGMYAGGRQEQKQQQDSSQDSLHAPARAIGRRQTKLKT